MEEIQKLRDNLDHLDQEIVSLLDERMRLCEMIGEKKREHKSTIVDVKREEMVLQKVQEKASHPIVRAYIGDLYKEILRLSKLSQRALLPSFSTIGIIGFGLMGGSLAQAVHLLNPSCKVLGLRDPSEDYAYALQKGWMHEEHTTLASLIPNVSLLILATPISSVIPLAEEIAKLTRVVEKKLIVMDLSSVKGEIVPLFERLTTEKIEFLSSHPMAGREKSGSIHSQADLFMERPWVLVPHRKNKKETLKALENLIESLGAKPSVLEARCHDEKVALISHLPSLLSKLYADFVSLLDSKSLQVAGPGFQSFTRLSQESPEMRSEVLRVNRHNVRHLLDAWIDHVQRNRRM